MGLLFYSCNANRDLISIASRSGLSVCYSTILRYVRALGKDAALALVHEEDLLAYAQTSGLLTEHEVGSAPLCLIRLT